ncbi:MAG: hypothetical protein Q4C87_12380 [Actinomycetaceae bacterium]|nr:hypothetical protein [Actinomycetaceae bacterium]
MCPLEGWALGAVDEDTGPARRRASELDEAAGQTWDEVWADSGDSSSWEGLATWAESLP